MSASPSDLHVHSWVLLSHVVEENNVFSNLHTLFSRTYCCWKVFWHVLSYHTIYTNSLWLTKTYYWTSLDHIKTLEFINKHIQYMTRNIDIYCGKFMNFIAQTQHIYTPTMFYKQQIICCHICLYITKHLLWLWDEGKKNALSWRKGKTNLK